MHDRTVRTGRVRVGIVLSDGLTSQGGIGRLTGYLVREFADRRTDIAVRVLPARLSTRGVLKHLTMPVALARFAVACRRLDVAHINVAPRGSTWRKMAFARVAAALGVPVLLHLHGSGYDQYYAGQGARRQAAIRRFFATAGAVVVLGPYWARFMAETLGVPAGRIHEIANGVPAAHPPVAPRATAAAPLIVFLGIVGERKGTDVLLAALAKLDAAGVAWRAVFGGNGEVDAAQAQAAALGLDGRVEFTGWVGEAEVDRLLRRADIFVLPSRAENQPVAILEAMARAVPVVSTDVGGIPGQVVDGETALLVRPGDAAALAAAIGRLIDDPGLRARMGAAGLARFESHFAVSVCADRFAALYPVIATARRP